MQPVARGGRGDELRLAAVDLYPVEDRVRVGAGGEDRRALDHRGAGRVRAAEAGDQRADRVVTCGLDDFVLGGVHDSGCSSS